MMKKSRIRSRQDIKNQSNSIFSHFLFNVRINQIQLIQSYHNLSMNMHADVFSLIKFLFYFSHTRSDMNMITKTDISRWIELQIFPPFLSKHHIFYRYRKGGEKIDVIENSMYKFIHRWEQTNSFIIRCEWKCNKKDIMIFLNLD
jgi:hypothetical protein